MNDALRSKLLSLRARDEDKRAELVERGELFAGYHPEMKRIHDENAEALEAELHRGGWPATRDVGAEAAEAAWIVAMHAIGRPAFQRLCLTLLDRAVERNGASAIHRATLLDRIRFYERRPQLYGTQLDWDEHGQLSPWPIEDAGGLAERRREIGLPPLEDVVRNSRDRARREGDGPPASYEARQAEILAWAKRAGWVKD